MRACGVPRSLYRGEVKRSIDAVAVVLLASGACTFNSTTIVVAGDTEGDTGSMAASTSGPGSGPGTSAADGTATSSPSGTDAEGPGTDDGPDPETDDGPGSSGDATTTGDTSGGPCVDTAWYPDTDSDGFGDPEGAVVMACDAPPGHVDNADDCDDTTETISPGVDETCDGIDNDCDLATDEWSPANASCGDCIAAVEGASAYYYCVGAVPWSDAEASCGLKGATLVRIDGQAENDVVAAGAAQQVQGDLWIGIQYDGADWRWTDGAIATFLAWRPGAPNGDGDCAELDTLDSGLWNDVPCALADSTEGWICEGPA